MAIRLLLLGTRYRQKLNFTFKALEAAEKGVERLQNFALMMSQYRLDLSNDPDNEMLLQKAKVDFEAAMDDDLNTSQALSVIFDLIRDVNQAVESEKLSEKMQRKSFIN